MIYEIGAGGLKPMSTDGKNDLELGRVLLFNGYGNSKQVIVKRDEVNPRFESSGRTYWCINPETGQKNGYQAYTLKFLSEKKDDRIAVYITDEIRPLDEVLELWEKHQAAELIEQAEKQKENDAKESGLKMLPSMYPHLETKQNSKKSSHALGAANIKRELAKAFPSVKFSVGSSSYSGGDSIDIHWTDGPTTDEVVKITSKFEEGSFDGMTDSYNYNDEIFPDVFGGAKYVMESRDISLKGIKTAWQKANRELSDIAVDNKGNWDRWASKNGDDVFRTWAKTSL